jgi:hypothetical protein
MIKLFFSTYHMYLTYLLIKKNNNNNNIYFLKMIQLSMMWKDPSFHIFPHLIISSFISVNSIFNLVIELNNN